MTLNLLSHVDEGMVYHDSPVVSPVSNPEGTASLDAQAGENLVRECLQGLGKTVKSQKMSSN